MICWSGSRWLRRLIHSRYVSVSSAERARSKFRYNFIRGILSRCARSSSAWRRGDSTSRLARKPALFLIVSNTVTLNTLKCCSWRCHRCPRRVQRRNLRCLTFDRVCYACQKISRAAGAKPRHAALCQHPTVVQRCWQILSRFRCNLPKSKLVLLH